MDATHDAGHRGPLRHAALLVAPLVVAAALAGAAVATVDRAGCDTPAVLVPSSQGVQYVGGCLDPAELPHGPAHPQTGDVRRG